MGQGCFITFEGIDGSGKSTQISYLRQYLEERDVPSIFVREPGGTPIGEQIRSILLDPQNSGMAPETEMLLYAASRAQLVREVIRPALTEGKTVVCDRFLDSSIAYQAYGRALGDAVSSVNAPAVDGLSPDVTFLVDVPAETGRARIADREHDRIEDEKASFFGAVRDGYLSLAEKEPGRIVVLDGTLPPEEIRSQILKRVDELIQQ